MGLDPSQTKPRPEGPIRRLIGRKFVRDTAILQLGDTANLAVAFITSVLLARLLTPSGYGVYALIYALFGLITVTGDLGLARATMTQLAEVFTLKRREEAAELCGYFVKLSLVLGLSLVVVGLIVGPPAAGKFYGNPEIGWLAALLTTEMLLGLPRNLARVAWQASRRMGLLSGFEVARSLVKLGLVIGLLLAGWGVKGAVLAEVLASALASLAAWPMMVRLSKEDPAVFPGLGEIALQAVRVPLKKHFAFGFKIVLDRNIIRILEAAPFLILGALGSSAAVGYLRVAWGAINLSLNLLQAVAKNLAARLPQLRAQGDAVGFWRIYFQTSLAGGAISLIGVGLLAALAPWLVELFYGAEFLPAVGHIYVIALAACLSGFFLGLGALYRSLHRMGLLAVVNAAQMVLYLPLGYLLIDIYQGLGGAIFIAGRVLLMNLVGLILALVLLRPR